MTEMTLRGVTVTIDAPLIDGCVEGTVCASDRSPGIGGYVVRAEGKAPQQSIGLRMRIAGALRFLRNGYHGWDGSEFVETAVLADRTTDAELVTGHAVTALTTPDGGAIIIGFERHDRFQSQLRFGMADGDLVLTAVTLTDATATVESETLLIFADASVEAGLRRWSHMVAAASPISPRVRDQRITGWCSWYNLYAQITPQLLRDHLHSATVFRDRHQVPFELFLIDDGFTPEMGDWLDLKPEFAEGMQPLIADVAAAGFTPALWVAPFLVGNRSTLFADHPDWVVGDRATGGPLVAMTYYGEFRWHKRSEEYYILDITHPGAEAHLAHVFRTWVDDWGARAVKTDFMYFGMEYGPERARWHTPGLSRVGVWRKMADLIRRAIGDDAIWLGCGAPLWASVGYFDANRIGRDVGVNWSGGEQSAESLLRDQVSRNHAHGILWQADPDCVLLRDRFHHLTDTQIAGLARLAAHAGGVLMTSDDLTALSPSRQALFAALLREPTTRCDFPQLGQGDDRQIVQVTTRNGETVTLTIDTVTGEHHLG